MAAHNQDGVVDVDGAFTRTDEALEAVLIEFLADVLVTTDLEAASWDVWMLDLLVLRIDGLIHGNWKDGEVTLLVMQLAICQDIIDEDRSLQFEEA